MDGADAGSRGLGGHVLFLNRRDCANPEGGGSEIYVETVARALAAGGCAVTLRSGDYPGAVQEEQVEGVRVVRRGSKLGMVPQAWWELRRGRLGRPDVVVDVQNGLPFGSHRADVPAVVLVHHVHREQWPVVYGPVRSRIGWALESQVAPRLYRRCQYVAVSETTRVELSTLGIDPARIEVIRNGVQPYGSGPPSPRPAPHPTILVLGRLVPHKRVEHVLDAAAALRHEIPNLRVRVVGDGWWQDRIRQRVGELRLESVVELVGFVDEAAKHAALEQAWVLAMPSLKEGWGLVITEAAAHGVPAVGYRSAGGVAEVIDDEASGLLVDGGVPELTGALRRVLTDEALRRKLAAGAAHRADSLSWQRTADAFAATLTEVSGRPFRAGAVTREALLTPVGSTGVDPVGGQLS